MSDAFIGVQTVARTRSKRPLQGKQIKRLNIELNRHLNAVPHAERRTVRLALLSTIFDRQFTSSKDVYLGEYLALLNELYNPKTAQRCADELNATVRSLAAASHV